MIFYTISCAIHICPFLFIGISKLWQNVILAFSKAGPVARAVKWPGRLRGSGDSPLLLCVLSWERSSGVPVLEIALRPALTLGPLQDSAGKDPRHKLAREQGFKRTSICDYHECYNWSRRHMAQPPDRRRAGKFSASGGYFWFALSDGVDEHHSEHDCIDLRKKTYTPPQGSSFNYEFSALYCSATPQIWMRFLPCRCETCRSMGFQHCPYSHQHVGLMRPAGTQFKQCKSMEQTRREQLAVREQGRQRRVTQVNDLRVANGMNPVELPAMVAAPAAGAAAAQLPVVPAAQPNDEDPLDLIDQDFVDATIAGAAAFQDAGGRLMEDEVEFQQIADNAQAPA